MNELDIAKIYVNIMDQNQNFKMFVLYCLLNCLLCFAYSLIGLFKRISCVYTRDSLVCRQTRQRRQGIQQLGSRAILEAERIRFIRSGLFVERNGPD